MPHHDYGQGKDVVHERADEIRRDPGMPGRSVIWFLRGYSVVYGAEETVSCGAGQ